MIIKRRPDWEFLQKLPKELHGFTFEEGGQLKGHEFVLGSYVNKEARRRLELIYTKETFDYVPVRQVGLLRYRDFRYITRDKDVFADWITGAIDRLVEETTPAYIPRSGHLLKDKGILDWHFPDTLPERVGNFVKFIGPRYPLDFINNATVILDYADFDVPAEDMLILTIDNDRAVTETSERIMKFCTDRGIEYRRSYFAGLALEEMVAIIAEKGFGNNRKYNIDIKVFITDGQIDIRLRDNFMYFDTAKRMEIMNSEDGISNIGIRIINSISHDTEYYSTLNVNYLVMHIAPQKQIPAQPKASLSLS